VVRAPRRGAGAVETLVGQDFYARAIADDARDVVVYFAFPRRRPVLHAAAARTLAAAGPYTHTRPLAIINLSVYFKSNHQNPTVKPLFRPPEGAQLKRPRRDPSGCLLIVSQCTRAQGVTL
jgi:hypothetical protein